MRRIYNNNNKNKLKAQRKLRINFESIFNEKLINEGIMKLTI